MQSTTNYMVKNLTQKKIASYTSRLLEGYNSIMAYDDNILSFRFSAYGTLVLFNIMDSYYDNKPITSEDISNGIDYSLLKLIIKDTITEVLTEKGLVAESSSKTKEQISFRVGQHVFEGVVTKIKKMK